MLDFSVVISFYFSVFSSFFSPQRRSNIFFFKLIVSDQILIFLVFQIFSWGQSCTGLRLICIADLCCWTLSSIAFECLFLIFFTDFKEMWEETLEMFIHTFTTLIPGKDLCFWNFGKPRWYTITHPQVTILWQKTPFCHSGKVYWGSD